MIKYLEYCSSFVIVSRCAPVGCVWNCWRGSWVPRAERTFLWLYFVMSCYSLRNISFIPTSELMLCGTISIFHLFYVCVLYYSRFQLHVRSVICYYCSLFISLCCFLHFIWFVGRLLVMILRDSFLCYMLFVRQPMGSQSELNIR